MDVPDLDNQIYSETVYQCKLIKIIILSTVYIPNICAYIPIFVTEKYYLNSWGLENLNDNFYWLISMICLIKLNRLKLI